ncbi:MAG: hypothetical protein OSA97_15455 [Nevskia sp.]|nr:hypothetical protein [Nevskia sp.]
MKKFMAVYIGTAASLEKYQQRHPDAATREARQKAGMEAWSQWVAAHAGSIVDIGTPLGKTKRVAAEGITDLRNNLTAYTIVQAESHQAAARMFENHPHFTLFPGDSVEVMECLPLPAP